MNKLIKIILYMIIILICSAIFKFSSQVANTSDELSKSVTKKIVDVMPQYKDLNDQQKVPIVKSYHNYIRKYAHFFLYFVLGMAVCVLAFQYTGKLNRVFLLSLLLSLLYAISDEIHQIFVPGRSCELRDVLIDFCGSSLGVLFIIFVRLFYQKLISKKIFD